MGVRSAPAPAKGIPPLFDGRFVEVGLVFEFTKGAGNDFRVAGRFAFGEMLWYCSAVFAEFRNWLKARATGSSSSLERFCKVVSSS